MKKLLPYLLFQCLVIIQVHGQEKPFHAKSTNGDEQGLEVPKSLVIPQDRKAYQEAMEGWYTKDKNAHSNRANWFVNARFGCFVHWGVYASLAGEWKGIGKLGYAEHIMRARTIPLQEYKEKVVANFDPNQFNADGWMKTVRDAGMNYFIITAKHHDGFAMYPSNAYPYDIRQTRLKLDPMKELCIAAKKYGIKFGFYYSHAFDWEHPDAPGNDWDYPNPGGDKLLHGANWWESYSQFLPNAEKYVREKSIPQILELIHQYHPDILWFDTPQKLPMYLNLEILKAIREADSRIVVNGRLARVGNINFGDYANTGDRAAFFPPTAGIWEAIPTTNESYGYNKFDSSHKSPSHFIRLLANAAAKGGNILMNIGPKGDGSFDSKDAAILQTIGKWMKFNKESIYGTSKNPLPIPSWGAITQKGNTLYLHVFQWPRDQQLVIGGLKATIKKAYVLADPQKRDLMTRAINATDIMISLKGITPDPANTVIKLVCDSIVTANPIALLSSNDRNTVLVFDAQTHGSPFSYGDGKQNRNYVTNWKDRNQYLQWDLRLNEAADFRVSLEYNTANKVDSGTMVLMVNGVAYPFGYGPTADAGKMRSISLPVIHFGQGTQQIKLLLENYQGTQAMQPMQLQLLPIGN